MRERERERVAVSLLCLWKKFGSWATYSATWGVMRCPPPTRRHKRMTNLTDSFKPGSKAQETLESYWKSDGRVGLVSHDQIHECFYVMSCHVMSCVTTTTTMSKWGGGGEEKSHQQWRALTTQNVNNNAPHNQTKTWALNLSMLSFH